MKQESIFQAYKDIELRTGIQKLMSNEGSTIYIKRDDQIPYSYGGNSVRIAVEFFKDLEEKGCDAIISYGSRHSNMNRVVSQLARDAGIPCRIVTSLSIEEYDYVMDAYLKQLCFGVEKAGLYKHRNEELADSFGALRTFCKRSEVQSTIEDVMGQLRALGHKSYYIYGDSSGKGNEEIALRAYDAAFDEITEYERSNGMEFDSIVCAYGTGITLEGLLRGRNRHKRRIKVCGISIARKGNEVNEEGNYYITDAYNGGGYEISNEMLESNIEQMEKTHGIHLDPIYTGKAFEGMLNEISKKRLCGNILFIHTGGYPVFEEWIGNKASIKKQKKGH